MNDSRFLPLLIEPLSKAQRDNMKSRLRGPPVVERTGAWLLASGRPNLQFTKSRKAVGDGNTGYRAA